MHGRAGGSIMFFFDCCRQGRAAGVQGPLAPGSPFAIALSLSVHQFYFSVLSADREERRALTYPIRKRRRPRLAVGVSCSKAPSTPRAPSLARRRRQLSARDFEIYVLPASRSQRDASTSFHSSFPLPTSYALQTVHTTLHYTTQPDNLPLPTLIRPPTRCLVIYEKPVSDLSFLYGPLLLVCASSTSWASGKPAIAAVAVAASANLMT